MRLRNDRTGDILELPPPRNELGESVVIFNGRVVEHVLYSDEGEGSVTTGDGRHFDNISWVKYVTGKLESGSWKASEKGAA